jgi:hypothetical protein
MLPPPQFLVQISYLIGKTYGRLAKFVPVILKFFFNTTYGFGTKFSPNKVVDVPSLFIIWAFQRTESRRLTLSGINSCCSDVVGSIAKRPSGSKLDHDGMSEICSASHISEEEEEFEADPRRKKQNIAD